MSISLGLFKGAREDPAPTIMDAMQKRDAKLLKKVRAAGTARAMATHDPARKHDACLTRFRLQ